MVKSKLLVVGSIMRGEDLIMVQNSTITRISDYLEIDTSGFNDRLAICPSAQPLQAITNFTIKIPSIRKAMDNFAAVPRIIPTHTP